MVCVARPKTPKWAVSPPEINLRGRTAHLGEAKASVSVVGIADELWIDAGREPARTKEEGDGHDP